MLVKKFVLSLFVIVLFTLYSFNQRTEGSGEGRIIPPQRNTNSAPASTNTILTPFPSGSASYKDGSYEGDVTDAFYGNLQVRAIIQSGKISEVQFLQYPNDRDTSIEINTQAMPLLKSEAIQAQSAQVDIIGGATQTSEAFIKSLQSALNKARG